MMLPHAVSGADYTLILSSENTSATIRSRAVGQPSEFYKPLIKAYTNLP